MIGLETSILQYIIICPLVFLAGFIDAIAGGGGLISLPAYMISGLPVHFAIGTNKMSSAMGTTLATAQFWRKGYINIKKSLLCAAFALIGSSIGAHLALLINDRPFKIIMMIILPLTAIYAFRSKKLGNDEIKEKISNIKLTIITSIISLVIGIYDGFYGPGTGTFLILLLTGLAHMSLNQAAGLTKAINLTTNITALAIYLMNGKVLLPLGIIAGIFNVAGNYMGVHFFTKKGVGFVRPVLIVVLTIFFVRVCYELFFKKYVG